MFLPWLRRFSRLTLNSAAGSKTQISAAAPCAQKKAQREGRTIVFIDESGLSQRPARVRTWAPKVQTPVLQYNFIWKQPAAIAGVTFWKFYFRLFPGSIKSPHLVEFLTALVRQIKGKPPDRLGGPLGPQEPFGA